MTKNKQLAISLFEKETGCFFFYNMKMLFLCVGTIWNKFGTNRFLASFQAVFSGHKKSRNPLIYKGLRDGAGGQNRTDNLLITKPFRTDFHRCTQMLTNGSV